MTERKLDNLGRIVIPKSFFRKLNFSEWQEVEITIEYGKICVKAYKDDGMEKRPYVGVVRGLDQLHRLTIPTEYLKILDMEKRIYYKLSLGAGKIIISKKEI